MTQKTHPPLLRPIIAAGLLAAPLLGALAGSAMADAPADADETTRAAITFVVAPSGNEARYRVREQLARISAPYDAVGRTNRVSGSITFTEDGALVPGMSRITVDVSSLQSDQRRRDEFMRLSLLDTPQHPNAVFVPRTIRGLARPIPSSGTRTFEILGDLTVRGVTRPATWNVNARFSSGVVSGTATTRFTFDDFGIEKPRMAFILTLADEIQLEYDFTLVADLGGESH